MKNNLSEADENKIYDCALNLLSLREHGTADLREKLLLRGAEDDLVQRVLERLQKSGLLSDERYAEAVYRAWLGKKGYGRQHLLLTLTKKLVPPECREGVLAEFTDAMEEEHARIAAELFRAKYAHKKFSDRRKLWATAAAFMVNRGFGYQYMELLQLKAGNRE